eukprot:Gregarina_sp_Poly_1__175@NODE_1040_length_5272_cov_13_452065_g720_i0_p5_GENE_NODE_1040_length_5272_cov_13_452065_g720_i0NODE_1040_length_5272_cov_13_452065_g720_i0_p5_ORF_typecomplete_len124_score13_94_NODE_1040_length_5272_cov_13_452065_g720_i024642835
MKSVHIKHKHIQSYRPTLSNVLIGCGAILSGNEEFAIKCQLDNCPLEHLGVCSALEAVKIKTHGASFSWNPTEVVPIKNLVRARLDYIAPYEEEEECIRLLEIVASQGLIVKNAKVVEKVFKD